MQRPTRWFSGHLGNRGPFLIFMGIGKICFGFSFIFDPPWSLDGLGMLLRWGPLHCWAWVWVLSGMACLGCAWLKFGWDGLGFVAASVPATLWAFTYGWAGLVDGYTRGLWLFVWYLASHCGVIWCASRVPPEAATPRPSGGTLEGRPG